MTLQDVKNAAHNFCLTADDVLGGYTAPDAVEADLRTLEDAIAAYRQAPAGSVEGT